MDYNFSEIEKKWREYWAQNATYKVETDTSKPKFYVLDMFPYPSGAGLHVGHPLGYIASDIYSRYKRHCGFNVLHPMGYDAFGLPAEQYAIQTGQHPAVTTEQNIKRYREQLDLIGFSYDWSREFRTCDPEYYKWTQATFLKLFSHYYDNKVNKAMPISSLVEEFEKNGNANVEAATTQEEIFTADQWKAMSESEKETTLQHFRLAYLADTMVNWCPNLGTVLANDEVKDGLSVRGGHPVEQKLMKQWSLRITAYVERLLNGLDNIDWTDSLKEIQRNWIGRSEGAEIDFKVKESDVHFTVFTTRPDTIYGSTFMVLAPESDLVAQVTTESQKAEIENYIDATKKRTERERLSDVKTVSGAFTGSYAINPFNGKEIPIWISDYVLAGYGTGAIMAVPAHDSRDYAFAKHFDLPIIQVVSGGDISEESYDAKEGKLMNSDFLDGLDVKDAISKACNEVEAKNLGKKKINYRLRDAIFSRQRYWGEPFPIYYKDGIACPLTEEDLPLELPEVKSYLPTADGKPPLGNANNWMTKDGYPIELSTMPGFAGSSAYYLRYMDPRNDKTLVSKEANQYWQDVDLYIGGTEHATGHLLYSRFWNKFLFDLGEVCKDEPFRKLINQGMIQGRSNFVYRIKNSNTFVSEGLKKDHDVTPIHVDVNIVNNDVLDLEAFKAWRPEFNDAEFILEDGKYNCGTAIEKMSKSMFNVVNPDDIVKNYGADTLRLYEMFLGPLEQSKPWNTNGIEGVHRFLKKMWRLYFDEKGQFLPENKEATEAEKRVLHKTIKKVQEDISNFSFNTSVSAFMIAVKELGELKTTSKEILSDLAVLISPFAPHIAEELWSALGNTTSVTEAKWPTLIPELAVDNMITMAISINGKTRDTMDVPKDIDKDEFLAKAKALPKIEKFLEGKTIVKEIYVPGRICNFVIK